MFGPSTTVGGICYRSRRPKGGALWKRLRAVVVDSDDSATAIFIRGRRVRLFVLFDDRRGIGWRPSPVPRSWP